MEPAIATAMISGVTSAFDKMIDAVVESKRIDAQIEAVRAQAEVEHHRLDVQEKALELRHKQIMKEIDENASVITKVLELNQKKIESSIKVQEFYCIQLARINDKILDVEISEEMRNTLIRHYEKIALKIENLSAKSIQGTIDLIQNNGSHYRLSSKKQKQISTEKE